MKNIINKIKNYLSKPASIPEIEAVQTEEAPVKLNPTEALRKHFEETGVCSQTDPHIIEVADAIDALRPFVGIQPQTSNNGEVFFLNYKEDEGKLALQIIGKSATSNEHGTVYAKSGKFADTLTEKVIGSLYQVAGEYDGAEIVVSDEQALTYVVEKVGTKIASEARRGKGNFVLLHPEDYADIAGTKKDDEEDDTPLPHLELVGVLYGTVRTYVSKHIVKGTILVGYKGSEYDSSVFLTPVRVGWVADAQEMEPLIFMRGGVSSTKYDFDELTGEANRLDYPERYIKKVKISTK